MERRIDVSKLREESPEMIEYLQRYIEEKIGVSAKEENDELIIRFEEGEEELSKRKFIKHHLKKALHKADMKADYRIVSDSTGTFLIVKTEKRREQ